MIDKKDVEAFFDGYAGRWDAEMIRSDEIIDIILGNAGVGEGRDVLDVACGTGVLFPDYIRHGARSVTAVDISSEMAKIAASKAAGSRISVVCADVEEFEPGRTFDCVVVYNAFPHFPDPVRLIEKLAELTAPGGRMTIAHGMSRAMLDHHHEGTARKVSNGLMSEHELAALMEPYFEVDTLISDDRMYQVAGTRRACG